MNKVFLLGNLGKDPELRYTGSGKQVTSFSLATTERGGEGKEFTTWHDVITWGQLAETCAQYLAKGRQVLVEGRINKRSYEDKEGRTVWKTEIVAQNVQFLGGGGGRKEDSLERNDRRDSRGEKKVRSESEDSSDDIPF